MNRIITLALLCALFLISCDTTGSGKHVRKVNGVEIPELLPREDTSGAFASEQKQVIAAYDAALKGLESDNADNKQYLQLATIFITEARATGNGGYYSTAAVSMLDKVLDGEMTTPDERFQALSLKSAVLLNMHQFKDALAVAQEGEKMNDFNAGIQGALVDAYVEMGRYKEAVAASDKMQAIRPDLRSYSRAAYLRQINGDDRGAAQAMKMAMQAGIPGQETTEWARVQLGDLYLQMGGVDTAEGLYLDALYFRPNYPTAEIALSKMLAAKGQYDSAILHTKNAIRGLKESSYIAYLADLHEMKGDAAKAAEIRQDVLRELLKAEEENEKQTIRHNGARELAVAYLKAGKLQEAMKYARTDYDMRPDNIDANELMAWIYYKLGDLQHATTHADKMLSTGSRNPATRYKAGIIYAKAGDAAKGAALKAEALATSKYIDPLLLNEGR